MKGRRGRNRDGRAHHREGVNAVSTKNLTVIWTPDDLRAAVTAIRALGEPELAAVAPVIDIKTRKRIG